MITFLDFLTEVKMAGSGPEGERHAGKYVTPFIGSKDTTHELASAAGGLEAGTKIRIHSHEVDDKGKHHLVVSSENSTKKIKIPQSVVNKNIKRGNKGLVQETRLASHLNNHGLMSGGGAGFTAGNDFHLVDKRKPTDAKIQGSSGEHTEQGGNPRTLEGEHKSDIKSTAFGQLTVIPHPVTGKWHIPDAARAKRPQYAAHIENSKVVGPDGVRRSLLDHMDKYDPPGTENKTGGYSERSDLSPAHAYMSDHHVHVAHIDSHGTYRAGLSDEKDNFKTGLPRMEGEGRFRYRQKQPSNRNSRSIQFGITKLAKSDVNIGTDDGAAEMKKRLGH